MRQLKRSRLKTYHIRSRTTEKNNEGVTSDIYGDAFPVQGEIWPATSKRQVELYGDRISDIANMRITGRYTIVIGGKRVLNIRREDGSVIRLGDGVCVYVSPDEEPDYRVLSITPYMPIKLEIEKI